MDYINNMQTPLDQYKTWLIANSRSKNTVRCYMHYVKDFLLAISYSDQLVIDENLINNYFAKLKEKTTEQATFNFHLSSVKNFLLFKNIDVRTPKRKLPTNKEVQFLSEQTFLETVVPFLETNFSDSLRLLAAFYCLFYTGVRVNELISLRRGNINFDRNLLIANATKQNWERPIAILDKLKKRLILYFQSEAEDINCFNLTNAHVDMVFAQLRVNFPELNIHPHKFRASFACYCYSVLKLDSMEIQKLLGHQSILTTLRYLKPLITDQMVNKMLLREKELIQNKKKG